MIRLERPATLPVRVVRPLTPWGPPDLLVTVQASTPGAVWRDPVAGGGVGPASRVHVHGPAVWSRGACWVCRVALEGASS